MSRHKALQYDLEDYYDDEEYYDEEEECWEGDDYDESAYQDAGVVGEGEGGGGADALSEDGLSLVGGAEKMTEGVVGGEEVEFFDIPDPVGFVLEQLAAASSTGDSFVSEARVKEMLRMYSGDAMQALAYFMKQKQSPSLSAPRAQTCPTSSSSWGSSSAAGPTLSAHSPISLPTTIAAGAGIPSSAATSIGDHGSGLTVDSSLGTPPRALSLGSTQQQPYSSRRPRGLSMDDYASMQPVAIGGAPLSPSTPIAAGRLHSLSIDASKKPHITLVVAGHVDAGKSTLVGQMLQKSGGGPSAKEVRKLQSIGGGFAWLTDEGESEREHGITIGVAERSLSTPNREFTVLDTPGHKDFIPNMISGASHADAALLVVTAAPGEFESSMSANAQTREHAVLLKALGIKHVVVAVNKMDKTAPDAWCADRYNQICRDILAFLTALHFKSEHIQFIPLSAHSGDNLGIDDKCPATWYSGPSLLAALNNLPEPHRQIDKPVRAVVTSVLSGTGASSDSASKTFMVSVKVLQGRLRVGRGVGLAPTPGVADVTKIIKQDGQIVKVLFPGECANVSLVDRGGRSVEEMNVWEGMILYKGPPAVRPVIRFKASLLTTVNMLTPMLPGSTYNLYLHGEELQCRIRKLYSSVKVSAGVGATETLVGSKKPKCIVANCKAYVQIQTERPVIIEPFSECKALGRFALRDKGVTCGVGVCDRIRIKSEIPSK